jgi:hypothetical protein
MNSLYERDLKDHMYAVARSTKILWSKYIMILKVANN